MNRRQALVLGVILAVNLVLVIGIFYTMWTADYSLFAVLIMAFALTGIVVAFLGPRARKWIASGKT